MSCGGAATSGVRGYRRSGITLTGVSVIILCIVVLVAVSAVILNSWFWRRAARDVDAMQIRQIHQSWLVYARQFEGLYPTPSLSRQGGEDISQNTTANLFSMCIMANYFSPELCIGVTEPLETTRRVTVKDDYNWDLYSPIDGRYWDGTLAADLETHSDVSYAHMPLFGENKDRHWREAIADQFPMIGNRGPRDGVDDPGSLTYRIYRPYDQWRGNICYSDNHVEFLDTFNPSGQDNIFAWDRGGPKGGPDAMITFTKAMTEDGPVIQHD